MISLLIGGDLVPTKSNHDLFNNGNVTALLGDKLLALWNAADIRVFNLETPLADRETPIRKCGPNLIAPTSTIKGIKSLNPTLLTLANNHILDQAEQGLVSTREALNNEHIPYIGVGDNLAAASQPYLIEKDGVKIGFYACAEHESSIAGDTTSGANPFDPLVSLEHISHLKQECDYVIVLHHGGKEHYRYPSPALQKICERMVEAGGDFIVCQHTHCIGAMEQYQGKTIVYGQGNFLFDGQDNEYWQTSLLIKIVIGPEINVDYIPIIKHGHIIRLADSIRGKEICQDFLKRSAEIRDTGFVAQKYQELAEQNIKRYLSELHGNNLILKVLNKLSNYKLIDLLYPKKSLLRIQNYIECEAHRELLLKGLSKRS